jgi:hypothetical protein
LFKSVNELKKSEIVSIVGQDAVADRFCFLHFLHHAPLELDKMVNTLASLWDLILKELHLLLIMPSIY